MRIALEARGQDLGLPGHRRRLEAFEERQDDRERLRSLQASLFPHMLPGEQKAEEVARRNRVYLRAKASDRVAMDAGQQPAVAPLLVVGARDETPTHDRAFGFQSRQRR